MSIPENNQEPNHTQQSDKERNFRALEAKVAQERAARLEIERENERLRQMAQQRTIVEEPEDNDEPYVDHKKLNKKLNKFGQDTQSEIQKAMELAKAAAKEELRQELWLESNVDFYDVLQHADKLAEKAPQLANSILKMPEGFERQKLVYQNIKALGIDKPKPTESEIQRKIDENKRSPYYQPSGVSSSPYQSVSDYSEKGQEQAYKKLQELKRGLRL